MAAAVKAGQGRLVWEAMAMANVAEVRQRIERILDETRQIPKGLTRSRWTALIACALPLIYVASVVQLVPAQAQVEQQLATPRKGTGPAPSAMSEAMKSKRQLGPADVAQMEQYLTTNPQDLDVRSQLVVYYFANGIREPRLSHIFWLIANHPESTQAVFTAKGLTPRTTTLNDASDYNRAAGLWKQQAASHATDPRILGNAADFLSQPGGDPEEAERLLNAARALQPGMMEWTNRLARLYTVAIVGSAGDPGYANLSPSFADRVKLQLESSTDGTMLRLTGRMLTAVAIRPQPGQKLPDGVLNLDEHPMLTPVVEMGNRLITRSEQFLGSISGVMGGVGGGVPGGVIDGVPGGVQGVFISGIQSRTVGGVIQSGPVRVPESVQLVQAPLAPALATAPSLVTKVDPTYPALARQARIQGDVRLMLQIGTDGHVQHIQVVSAHPLLVPSALEAVKQWVYAPIPAAGTIVVTVPFRLDGGSAPLGNTTAEQFIQTLRQQQINGIQSGPDGSNPQPTRIRIGGAVQSAKLVSRVDAVYPDQARAAGIEGNVVLEITVGEDGHVQSADPSEGHPLLVTAAADAVKQWVYRPTLLNGQPVSVITSVTVPFKLQ
jgi:TonB family protein